MKENMVHDLSNIENILNVLPDLADEKIFALLVILTTDEKVVLRPIGGKYGSEIIDAAKEAAEKYPGCKMRLFEENYDNWDRYFKHVISKEQVI
ncbi:hypothetical protein [Thermoanaerobacter thermocopriae]|uniref:hypothetical protein n=1 Tax=Thermoanaerobacter thermocopriae TaxID=29350 RepID=UPI00048E03A5|nr:hypothetical protein [Thermoanaerobacter thermocopriae]